MILVIHDQLKHHQTNRFHVKSGSSRYVDASNSQYVGEIQLLQLELELIQALGKAVERHMVGALEWQFS